MKALNWGILATGTIANKFADTIGKMNGEARLVAVASRRAESAAAFAAQYGVSKAYGSYEELVADPEIDAVYVATPHAFHYENMMLCLRAGKHVLCEKSFTTDAAQAKEVYACAKEHGLFVMEAYWTRFLPAVAKMKELLAAGTIGEVNFVTATYGYRNDAKRQRKFDPALAGGALLDIGIYNIGFACMVLGYEPADILTTVQLNEVGTDAGSAIVLRYPDGKFAQLTTAIQTTVPQKAIVYGTNGYLTLDALNGPQTLELAVDGQPPQVIEVPYELTGFEYQIREVQAGVAAGRTGSEIFRPEHSVAVMEIMDRVRAAWGMKFPFEK